MIAVSFVLILIFGCTNIFAYIQTTKRCDEIISFISDRESNVPPRPAFDSSNGEVDPNEFQFDDKFGKDATNQIRFFVVETTEEGYVFKFDERLDITTEEVVKMISYIDSKESTRGYYESYRYSKTSDGMYVFLYCGSDLESLNDFRQVSIFVSAGALLVTSIFLFIFSKRILQPVKETYIKQKQFISNASHELKTPLTIISANNELIELTKGESKYTSIIAKQVSKMNSMTKNLTLLARLNDDTVLPINEVDVSILLKEAIDGYTSQFNDRKLTLECDIKDEIILKTNSDFLGEIISIILDNSIKYAKSKVLISLKQEKGSIVLTQSNDCENIGNGDLNYYKDRFYRSDEARSQISGSGIGLSIASELANKIGASLNIYGENNNYYIDLVFKTN